MQKINGFLSRTGILIAGFAVFSSVAAQTLDESPIESKTLSAHSVFSEPLVIEIPAEIPAVEDRILVSNPGRRQYARPNAKMRFKRYVNSVFGPFALAGNAASAGFSTLTNSPEEWEKSGKGFAKRLASDFGRSTIEKTAIYGLDEALKLDSHYYPSRKRGTVNRIKHALLSPVTAFNKDGKKVFGASRVIGVYSAAVIARETWYPDRYGYKDGLKSGTITLGINAAINLFKEFYLY